MSVVRRARILVTAEVHPASGRASGSASKQPAAERARKPVTRALPGAAALALGVACLEHLRRRTVPCRRAASRDARAQPALRRSFVDGRIVVTPVAEGYYVAEGRFLPLVALTESRGTLLVARGATRAVYRDIIGV